MRKEHGVADGRAETSVAGSGNVFADLGIPHAEGALAKARLAEGIADTIQRRGLLQAEAGRMFGVEITIRRPRRYGNRGDLTVRVEVADLLTNPSDQARSPVEQHMEYQAQPDQVNPEIGGREC